MVIERDRELAAEQTVAVGVLYSLSGAMAAYESSLRDATLLAIDEINQAGGVLGCQLVPHCADGASLPEVFAREIQHLFDADQAVTVFGGWTSATRKAIRPIVEHYDNLLWYPLQHEGLEVSSNIAYTGICANQQLTTALQWLADQRRSRLYLLGSDYVFPRMLHKIAHALLPHYNLSCVGEEHLARGETNFDLTIAAIQDCGAQAILSTLNGDHDTDFYHQYRAAGLHPDCLPILSVNITEAELQHLDPAAVAGHYCAWGYFQSLPTAANQQFVSNFQARYGSDRVTSEPVETAYTQVYLWKLAVERAGSFAPAAVRAAAPGLEFEAPSGRLRLANNLHLARPCYIGRILASGQFEIVSQTERIEPLPWFGLEGWENPQRTVVAALLGEVSQSILHSCHVEASARIQAALALELTTANNGLRQTQQQLLAVKAREMLLERQLASQIRNSLDLDTVLASAVAEIANLLKLDRCLFLWHNEAAASLEIAAAKSPSLDETTLPPVEVVAQIVARIPLADEPLLRIDAVVSAEHLPPATRLRLRQLNLQALIAAPVRTRFGRSGLVLCEQYDQSRVWRERELSLLEAVVNQLAIAIEQAQLYEQSRTAAAVAQARADQLKQALSELQQTQAHLVQSEKMSALGMLTAGLAHEIKNPVGFICGNLTYAQEYATAAIATIQLYQKHFPTPPAEIRDFIAEIELDFLLEDFPKTLASMAVGADRIQELVLSLRNFSRTDQTGTETADLHAGIESAFLILSHRLRPRGKRTAIDVVKDYGDLPEIDCYPSQLNQVFVNLIGNAIDALEAQAEVGQPAQIRVRTRTVADVVEVSVADNGPGIPPEIQQRLFDPFFTTKPTGKGTGLGLSICQQIIAKHGGTLRCYSEPNGGTEFAIQLQQAPVAAVSVEDVA